MYPDQAVGRDRLVSAERTSVPEVVRRRTPEAYRRAATSARSACAAPRGRIPHHTITGRPAGAIRRGGHNARPLVAENGTRFGVTLQDHVQIGSANPALGNFDEHLSGSRLWKGNLLDGDPAVAHVDGCRHQIGRHGANTKGLFSSTPRSHAWATVDTPPTHSAAMEGLSATLTSALNWNHGRLVSVYRVRLRSVRLDSIEIFDHRKRASAGVGHLGRH
jgi:hypothetical protein